MQSLNKKNFFVDLDKYTPNMTISKVIKFFERYGVLFTKTTIQNYVRVGVLPEPYNKRYYQKKHMVILLLVYDLKNIFSLDNLKELVAPLFDADDADCLAVIDYFNNIFNNEIKSGSYALSNDPGAFAPLLALSAKALADKYIILEELQNSKN
ncbi:MAG: DUF1836 domain-containing protein [Clostridiales bacterium]|jgi:DNA-binding transcriptional MerR regulator|nr:DUF1836 domain-containing protein [Clostridiales bacterium]